MRRGLISRAPSELPDAVLEARLARVRAAMHEQQLDALLVYTNNTRAAGVSWLTGFVPYWSEALLLLARDRPPALIVALTYRVKSWIERVSRVAEVIHTPRIGLEAGRMIAELAADAAAGIPELDSLSAGIVEDLRAAGPRLQLTDASSWFAPLRSQADPAEIALAMKAASIAGRALARASGSSAGGEGGRRRAGGTHARCRGGLHCRCPRSRARSPLAAARRGGCNARRQLCAARDRGLPRHLGAAPAQLRSRRRR